METKYCFFSKQIVYFDNSRSVKELVDYAYARRPIPLLDSSIITVFQAHSRRSNHGWFTRDVHRSCASEIENPRELCFAFNVPGLLFFAEGGWGHHMKSLGNHPSLPLPILLNLQFTNYGNDMTVAGLHSFRYLIKKMVKVGFLSGKETQIVISFENPKRKTRHIGLSNPLLWIPLIVFKWLWPDDLTTFEVC